MHRIRDLIGIKYVDGGRDTKTGLDCLGLARIAVHRFNPEVDAPGDYIDHACTAAVTGLYNQEISNWQRIDAPVSGCIVLMKIDPVRPELVQHLGVYVGGGRILQTLKTKGSHIISVDDPYFGKKIAGYYQWKKNK